MLRPKIHFTAERNWINDPNGFIYYKGEYHLYYQCFPYSCEWGTMHWGHATSKDLVNFEHHPIALYPSKEYDCNGCFSGTAIAEEDCLRIYYTGVKYNKTLDGDIHRPENDNFVACQVEITSKDGYKFDNIKDKTLIIPPVTDKALGNKTHTRDPKVWKYKDKYSMILGSKFEKENHKGFIGEALFYTSDDGNKWTYKNRCFDERIGEMWECPDLFKVDGKYVLILSPENITLDGKNYKNNSIYSIVEYDEDECEMKIVNNYSYVDLGLDLYAPQTTLDKYGNRIMIGWMRMPKVFEGEEWIGMMSLPRVINVVDNNVYFNVPDYVDKLFDKKVDILNFKFNEPYKIDAKLKEGSSLKIGELVISVENDQVFVDRSKIFVSDVQIGTVFNTPKLDSKYDLKIYVDNGIVEIFINDGRYVISNIVYNNKGSIKAKNIESVEVYSM